MNSITRSFVNYIHIRDTTLAPVLKILVIRNHFMLGENVHVLMFVRMANIAWIAYEIGRYLIVDQPKPHLAVTGFV